MSLAGTIVAGIALILSITIGSVSLAALSAIDEALDAGNTLPENIAEDITEDVLDDVEDVVIPGNADDAEEIDSGSNDDDADTNEFISDDIAVKYVSHNTVKDYEDNDCLRVVFEYTNNSDDTTSFMFSTNVSAFQNGVELDTAVTLDEDEEENNSLKEVRPGTTINVARIFVLEDTSDVEIEVSELISFDDDKMLMTLPVE